MSGIVTVLFNALRLPARRKLYTFSFVILFRVSLAELEFIVCSVLDLLRYVGFDVLALATSGLFLSPPVSHTDTLCIFL